MQRVQGRRGGRRHPGGVGAGLRVLDLRLQHGSHQVGHGPHALADLRPAGQPAFQADIDVHVLIGADPGLALDELLAAEGSRLHRGVDLVAGAIEETCIDEGHPVPRGADAFFQVRAGAALFVHHPQLDGVLRQAENFLDPVEGFVGEGDLFGAVHLGFDHVDRALDRVAHAAGLFQVVDGDDSGAERIDQALVGLVAIAIQDRGVGHQVADIAHPHQRPALQRDLAALRRRQHQILGQTPGEAAPALFDFRLERALHQPKPVAVGKHLVLGIDAGHRILAVHNRGHGAFQPHIGQPGLVARADHVSAVEDQLHMQAVVAQDDPVRRHGPPGVTHELLGVGQRQVVGQKRAVLDVVAAHVGVAGALDGKGLVQKHPRPRHHARTAAAVVAAGRRRAAHRVGPVIGVVKRAPARIRGIHRVAGVGDRHDKLRAGHLGNLRVDVFGVDAEIFALWNEIADFLQKRLVGLVIMRLVAAFTVPVVQLGLQVLAFLKQLSVSWSKLMDQFRHALPEGFRRYTRPRKRLAVDEFRELPVYLKAMPFHPFDHHRHPRSCRPETLHFRQLVRE